MKEIPPEAGFPGLPIDDSPPETAKAFAFLNEEIRPRREFHEEMVRGSSFTGLLIVANQLSPIHVEHIFVVVCKGPRGEWRKVEFGKLGGSLYPVCASTPWDLKEFGLGVAMYFQTLQLLTLTFMFCGFMQAQAIQYYSSDKYSDGQPGVVGFLRGSSICTRQHTVCLDSFCSEVGRKKLCKAGLVQAQCDLTMTIILLVLIAIISTVQNGVSTALDESMQTAQDYSIFVDDPGPEDDDPQEWADFFSQFGHVTFVTIAKDNGPLIKAMATRRAIMREIVMMIGNGEASVEEDDDGILDTTWDGKDFPTMLRESSASPNGIIVKSGVFGMQPMSRWRRDLAKANRAIQTAINAHAKKPFSPSKVFVTFETEAEQRRCIKALKQGAIAAALNLNANKLAPEHVFKGTNVLSVSEAPEPNEIFWEDVQVTVFIRLRQQTLTFLITVLLVCGSVEACKIVKSSYGSNGAAAWISVSNILVPYALRLLSFYFEDHVSLNTQQLSLFLKLSFFRWFNSAIVLFLITDFKEMLTEEAMAQVKAVLIADAITTPLLRTIDPYEAIQQIWISKYAYTQEKMNSFFYGVEWYPAERYADMTKTLFLALFYSALFPAGLFLTSLSFFFCYIVDKYSLLRTWRTPAELGPSMMKMSRGHMAFAVFCHAVMSMIFFTEFPFDNLCKDRRAGHLEPQRYKVAKALFNVTTDHVYHRCDQHFAGRAHSAFLDEDTDRNTVRGEQKHIVRAFVTLVTVLAVLFCGLFFGRMLISCYHPFHKLRMEENNPNETPFTSCDIQAYIPVIRHPSLAFPLVAADVTSFNCKYLPFQLPKDELYHAQSLVNKNELKGFRDEEMKALFSEVRFFPPPSETEDHFKAYPTLKLQKKKKRSSVLSTATRYLPRPAFTPRELPSSDTTNVETAPGEEPAEESYPVVKLGHHHKKKKEAGSTHSKPGRGGYKRVPSSSLDLPTGW